jgi:alpha-glucosidase
VLAEGADAVEVAFPPGEWVHLLTGETFEGERTARVSAPVGTPAAFVRSDDPRLADLQSMIARADL